MIRCGRLGIKREIRAFQEKKKKTLRKNGKDKRFFCRRT